MNLQLKPLTKLRCVGCGDAATGFKHTKPLCTICYNKELYLARIQKHRDKRDRTIRRLKDDLEKTN